jgi:hypothetical protein
VTGTGDQINVRPKFRSPVPVTLRTLSVDEPRCQSRQLAAVSWDLPFKASHDYVTDKVSLQGKEDQAGGNIPSGEPAISK